MAILHTNGPPLILDDLGTDNRQDAFTHGFTYSGHPVACAAGLNVRPIGHLTVMSPPLIMARSQIDELIAILRECISVTADELTREGYRLV